MEANFTDWLAIVERKARYCRCLDTKDWDGYTDCFTEDVVFDSQQGGPPIVGRTRAMEMVIGAVGKCVTTHQVHNPEIRFADDGKSADVIWAMQDRVRSDEARRLRMGNAGHTGYGHYHEKYVKCDDGEWRIAALRLSYLQMDFHEAARF